MDMSGQGIRVLTAPVFSYTFLNDLYIASNKISQLPAAIGKLRQLRHLDASNNALTELPPELGMCVYLKQLLLFDNNIRSLPNELGSLYQLEMLGIEGNPLDAAMKQEIMDSPINEGTLCPKGSNALLLALNPHRMKTVLYRAPYSDKWETKTLDWALDQIAQRVKAARDADFTVRDQEGRTLNSVRNMGTLGGATPEHRGQLPDQEAVLGGLGVVSVENQART